MECPMAKRPKLDDTEMPHTNNCTDSNEDDDAPANVDSLHEKLRQFDVLDEVQGDESDSDETTGEFRFAFVSECGNVICVHVLRPLGYQSSDSDIDDDELDTLLNEALPEDLRSRKKDVQYEERFKTVLEGMLFK